LEYYPNFYLAFWEAYFPKIKGKESLSRWHDLNMTDWELLCKLSCVMYMHI
jgi:hypothetical protein